MSASRAYEPALVTGAEPTTPRAFTALASWVRVRMVELLSTREMTVPELAKKLDLHRATVRYHLTFLLDRNLVEPAGPSPRKGAGRPAMRYHAARHARMPNFPSRQFELLAGIALRTLAEEIGAERAMVVLRAKGVEIGKAFVEGAAGRAGVDEWTPEAFQRVFVEGEMRTFGIATMTLSCGPRHLAFRCFSCPFLEVAEQNKELVCNSLDLGFHEGIDRALGDVQTLRLSCLGHGDPYCEYRMTWGPEKRGKARR